jgi:cation diffusion facilitator family transporter
VLQIKLLIYANIVANFALAGLQLYAAVSSGSLSLFATMSDSVFDPFANVLLNWLHRKSERLDERKWPAGGSRLTNAGNITYSAIMLSVSLVLVVESIRALATHDPNDKPELYIPSIVAVGVAFAVKALLAVINYGFRKYSSQLEMLYIDCRNDLFINGLGIFTSAAGAKIVWWLDPAGAMVISIGIIVVWTRTALGEFKELCGISAPPEFYQLVTYNALLHSEHISSIDSIKAYHSGPNYVVEVDLVMDKNAPLHLTHDVSQDLQDRLEALPNVERAFVHCDWEVTHAPEHRKNK